MRTGEPTHQVPRALRAAVFAAVCVLLAALGHAVMSGTDVPWWAVAVALCGTGSCAWFAAGRERGPLLITLATVGAQTAMHSFFSLAQQVAHKAAAAGTGAMPDAALQTGDASCGGLPMPLGSGGGGTAGMAHSMPDALGMPMDAMTMDVMPMHAMPLHLGHGALGMWSAHVLVAVVCGIWLSGGEQAAFRLGRAIGARLFAPLLFLFHDAPVRQGPPRVRAGLWRAAQRLRRLLYAHVLDTRGPPTVRAAVA
ncbi:hypothetical protein VR41_05945 [Streptomyces sp. NRRL B-1568]|nr:hypothetical protein VR41_05945 [Streptomyces sp. NRRL B-1568]